MNTFIYIDSKDETGDLAAHFNLMVKKLNELILRNKYEQKKKREYELSLLQAQIKPHFLYNTLESVRSLILRNDNDLAFDTITNLGNFYKDVLNGGDNIITVEKEIKLTKNYMKIQQIRHEDLFNFNIEVDNNILKCSILKLTLQPIVENSIKHGFRGTGIKGLISIKGFKKGNDMLIKIIDNFVIQTFFILVIKLYFINGIL